MDFFSSSQLKCYESIVEKIQSEQQRCANLKKEIQDTNNRLIISQLSKAKPPHKLAQVNVKIFSDLFDLFNLYGDEINSSKPVLLKCENCKFYLVEVFVTNALQNKLKDFDWCLNICIKGGHSSINKSVNLLNKQFPIVDVLPVDDQIIECEIDISIVLICSGTVLHLNLEKVYVDIFHHIQMTKKVAQMSTPRKILEIANNHNSIANITDIRRPLFLEYEFLVKIDSKEFVKMFLKNCYHTVDMELFSELPNDPDHVFVIQFSTGNNKHSLRFNRSSNSMKIKSNFKDLKLLKKYLCKEIYKLPPTSNGEGCRVPNVKNVLSRTEELKSVEELKALYVEVRSIWATLTV